MIGTLKLDAVLVGHGHGLMKGKRRLTVAAFRH
jgi:hypothetical protein